MRGVLVSAFLLLFFFFFLLPAASAQLRNGFYSRSCPRAESIIRQVVASRFLRDRSITAALLRMHFHDCFVRGCDASLLLDPTRGRQSEKNAGANGSVRGYELIDEIKSRLEAECPNTVSCSDIVALATRDSVALAGGPRYSLPTGRRDGLISNPNDVNLPGPTIPVPQALQLFVSKGMTVTDFVALLGAHTVGITHCSFVRGGPMELSLAAKLRKTCRAPGDPAVFLDQKTPFKIDSEFYRQIRLRRGVLKLDQDLATDALTRGVVARFASNNALFRQRFAAAMVKMGGVDVLTGRAGEIRRKCRLVNRR